MSGKMRNASEYFRKYYENHKEQDRKAKKKYYSGNSDKIKAKAREYHNKNYSSGICASRMGNMGSPVLCIETGEIFDSAKEASIHINRAKSAVAASIHLSHKCAGYTWRYLTKEEIEDLESL